MPGGMAGDLAGKGAAGPGNGVYLDTTFLRFAKDLRGIPQVLFQMAEVLAREPEFSGTGFIAAKGTYETFLEPLGVPEERIIYLPSIPGIGHYERFHGLGSTFRYRRVLADRPRLIIHPEPRSITRLDSPQAVFYHDTMDLESLGPFRTKWDRWLYYRYKSRMASRSRFKMANSEYTKDKLLRHFPDLDPQSIRVVHLGVRSELGSSSASSQPDSGPLQALYVGAYEARKNIPGLLMNLDAAFGGRPGTLHLAGRISPEKRRELQAVAQRAGTASRIEWHGLIGDSELRALYQRCGYLLFPSSEEGFGLPLVEAMAHGMVVCAFRNSAIPEVVGDAGILASNGDFAAWGKAIAALVADPERQWALRMRARATGE
jgi:glycosyltransferase involved in cell wall biosynthesis